MSEESMKMVDLRPDARGDHIAVVTDGEVSYLPATRVDIGAQHQGASGSCRYVRRAKNGDLYVTGPGLGMRMFRSRDEGMSWTSYEYVLGLERFNLDRAPRDEAIGWIGAFTILRDDTFLMNIMPSNHQRNWESYIARSGDFGEHWTVERMDLPLMKKVSVVAGNSDMVELKDGTILLTMDNAYHADIEDPAVPLDYWCHNSIALRSHDGGRTWPEKSTISISGGEVHLLVLPSGKVLAAIRKQRNTRLPGDPEDINVVMRADGYDPEYSGYVQPISEGTAFLKSVHVSESKDGGRTWVNERRVSRYEQCSGELTLLGDGQTLVLQYDSRYHDRFARTGVRGLVSYDLGETWGAQEYIIGEGENYPGAVATADGGLMTVCPYQNEGPIQAVHWRPRPKNA